MARGITKGVIKEAINKLGGSVDDAVRKTVDNFAETATRFAGDMDTSPRKAFSQMVDDFGGIKYGDNFVARNSNLYGSNAPIYTGKEFTMKKPVRLGPDDVEVIPPSWNRGAADFQAPATRPSAELSYNPGTKFTMGDSGPVEYTGQNFTMGNSSDTVYTGPMKGSTELATVNSNTGLAQRRLDNTADMARDAYIDQDITSRMNNMDAASQARAQQKAADAKRAEFLGRNGRREDGSRMGFFERRNAKKYYQNQDWLTNADKYANGEVDINGIAKNNAESGAGWWDGVTGWAKLGGAAVAGGIAGAVLSDD